MRILIVEDDALLGSLLERSLKELFTVNRVATAQEAEAYIQSYRYDALVLDRMLGGRDVGLGLIRRFKSRSPEGGVLVISARGETEERIAGLESGADDYLPKPLDIRELIARLNALTRRRMPKTLALGPWLLELDDRQVFKEGEPVRLTRKESDLLFALARRAGKIISRDALQDALYQDPASVASNTIEAIVKSLRKKLPGLPIETVKTRGYLLKN